MNFFYNKKRLLIKIGIILILILIIMLTIYFLVIKKSTSSNTHLSLNTSVITNATEATETTDDIVDNNTVGFCLVSTRNGKDKKEFLPKFMWDNNTWPTLFANADNGIPGEYNILNKWAYDSNNKLIIERTINNTNNNTNKAYSQTELDALGKAESSTSNTYSVNKLIPTYNSANLNLTKDGPYMRIKPWILSLYSDCK